MKAALRKFILLGLSFALIFAVVLIYSRIAGPQGTPSSTPDSPGPNGPSTLDPTIKRIGGRERTLQRGEKVEIYIRGPGGRIQREYHIERLILQTEDQASLEDVRLVWHLKDGQTLTLTSQRGDVHIERGALGRMQPTRGLLTGNVQIVLDASPEDQPKQRPLGQRDSEKLIITTDKLDFDIRSCRLSTDQPVQLRGARLDAYGTGLVLRWREISKDIDALIIKQGGQLTWQPAPGRGFVSLMPPEEQKPQTTSPLLPQPPKEQVQPERIRTKEQVQPEEIHSYLATFQQNVRVTYKDQVIHNVDFLNVAFDLHPSDAPDTAAEGAEPSRDSAAEPGASQRSQSTQPSQPTVQADEPSVQAPVRLTWTGPMTIVPEERKDYQPTAQRRFEVEALGAPVKFSSKDMSGECARLEAEHHSGIVRLFSSPEFPVILNGTDGTEITCKEQIDIDFSDSRVATATLGKGSLKSSGRALSPGSSEPGQDSKPIDLSWDGHAKLKFLEDTRPLKDRPKSDPTETQSDYYLAEATAQKNVQAVSDKFNASAHYMHIELGPPGSDGTPRGREILLLEAKDDFFSVLSDDNRSISADSMKTHFTRCRSGTGQFPSRIELNGHVLASQPPQPPGPRPQQHTKSPSEPSTADQGKSFLQSQEMDITLIEPDDVTTSSTDSYAAARISHLLARGQVIGRYEPEGADPSNLSAHTLEWDLATKTTTLKGGPARVELEHPKDEEEKEEEEKDWLESEIIEIVEKDRPNGDEGTYYVLSTPGRGKMRTSFAGSEEGAEPAPVGLNWPGYMLFDGLANKASFTGTDDQRVKGAIVHSPACASEFEADQLDLYLRKAEDKPPAQLPSANKEAKGLPSGQTFFKPMSGRSLEKMVLTGKAGKALVRAVEQAADGSKKILRRVLLTSDVLTYLAGKDNKGLHGQGPGTLLLEDYRPTDKVVSDEKPTSGPLAKTPKPRNPLRLQRVGDGKTGFWWTDSADYYQDERKAVLRGDVQMISRGYALTLPAKPSERANAPNRRDRTELWAQKLTVTHAEPKADKTAQKESDFADLSAMDELEIESVEAVGSSSSDATLSSSNVDIQGYRIFYSTKTNEIRIEGTGRRKAVLTYNDPEKGWGTWTGKIIRYNTVTHKADAPGGRFQAFSP